MGIQAVRVGRRAHGVPGVPRARPGSENYAPFLVLVSRLSAGAPRLGRSSVTGLEVYFTPLDDGSVVAVSATEKRGETHAGAIQRIEKYVARAIEPKLGISERFAVKQRLGMIMGLADIPDATLGQNPYGVAFSLARRDQLGLDPARLNRALEAVTDADLKRVAEEVFAPSRHGAAVVGSGEPGK